MQDLALLLEVVQDGKHLRPVVDIGWRAVQLDQVERLQPGVGQAVLDEAGDVLPVIPVGRVGP